PTDVHDHLRSGREGGKNWPGSTIDRPRASWQAGGRGRRRAYIGVRIPLLGYPIDPRRFTPDTSMRLRQFHRAPSWGMAVSTALPFLLAVASAAAAQGLTPAAPVFADGQAQIVPAFQDSARWIREELWVETEFDSD